MGKHSYSGKNLFCKDENSFRRVWSPFQKGKLTGSQIIVSLFKWEKKHRYRGLYLDKVCWASNKDTLWYFMYGHSARPGIAAHTSRLAFWDSQWGVTTYFLWEIKVIIAEISWKPHLIQNSVHLIREPNNMSMKICIICSMTLINHNVHH